MTRYDFIKDAYEFRMVNKNGKWGIIDKKDRLIVPVAYDEFQIKEGFDLIFYRKDNTEGFINFKGEIILENKDDARIIGKMGKTILISANDKGKKSALYDSTGKKILEPLYDNFYIISNTALIAEKNGKMGVIELFPEVKSIFDFKYVSIHRWDDLIVVKNKNQKYGVYDLKGSMVIPEIYDSCDVRNNVYMNKESSFDIFDKKGKYIKTIKGFTYSEEIQNERLIVEKDGKQGVIDIDGNVRIPIIYDVIEPNGNCKYYFANIKGKKALLTEKEQLTPFEYECIFKCETKDQEQTLFLAEKVINNKYYWGVLDEKGKVILPPVYEDIEICFIDLGYLIVTNEDYKRGVVDLKGNIVLDAIYEGIHDICGNKIEVWFNGSTGYVLIE